MLDYPRHHRPERSATGGFTGRYFSEMSVFYPQRPPIAYDQNNVSFLSMCLRVVVCPSYDRLEPLNQHLGTRAANVCQARPLRTGGLQEGLIEPRNLAASCRFELSTRSQQFIRFACNYGALDESFVQDSTLDQDWYKVALKAPVGSYVEAGFSNGAICTSIL